MCAAVLEPERAGLEESDLESLHDYLNTSMAEWLGSDYGLRDCFSFLNSREGEEALGRCQVKQEHRAFLQHFARLILQEDYQPNP